MTELGISEGTLPMLDLPCPEYFVTDIGRVESAGKNHLRFYCCSQRGDHLEPQYTAILPVEVLAVMARMLMLLAAEHHNRIMMLISPKTAH